MGEYNPTRLERIRDAIDLWIWLHTPRLDMVLLALARKLPRRFLMWCYIVVAAHATSGPWGDEAPDTVDVCTALRRWGEDHA